MVCLESNDSRLQKEAVPLGGGCSSHLTCSATTLRAGYGRITLLPPRRGEAWYTVQSPQREAAPEKACVEPKWEVSPDLSGLTSCSSALRHALARSWQALRGLGHVETGQSLQLCLQTCMANAVEWLRGVGGKRAVFEVSLHKDLAGE